MPRGYAIRFFAVAITFVLVGPLWASAYAQALSVDDALAARALLQRSPIEPSPDGEWLAYVSQERIGRVSATDRGFTQHTSRGVPIEAVGTDIMVVSLVNGESIHLGVHGAATWSPAWSPDGKKLAFISDRDGVARLWIWDKSTRRARRASAVVVHPFFNFEVLHWTADSKTVVAKVLAQEQSLPAPVGRRSSISNVDTPTVRLYEPSSRSTAGVAITEPDTALVQGSFMERQRADIAAIDLASGRVRRLAGHPQGGL
jgi:Tol biopolymer transport system component